MIVVALGCDDAHFRVTCEDSVFGCPEERDSGGMMGDSSMMGECATGTFDHDDDASTECVAWTDCEAGQYETTAGTPTSDRVCRACASGTFSTETNALGCIPWQDCEAGTYVSVEGSATGDRECATCAEGTYTDGPNQSSCLPLDACPAGTVQTAPGTDTTPPSCEACSVGQYCMGDTAAPVVCGDGDTTWDHDADPATACVERTECLAGNFVAVEGDGTTDRTCEVCGTGTFSTTSNAQSCDAWTTCVAGEYVETAGTTTTDQVCTTCAAGSYSAVQDAQSCTTWTDCVAGEFEETAGSSTTNRVCTGCASGTFSTTTNAGSCTAWTDCVAGEYVSTAGTASADRVCTDCPPDTYTSGPNQAVCVDVGTCAPGTVQTAPGNDTMPPECTACSAGEYCAGDTAPVVNCDDGDGTWDDDSDPATACVPRTDCTAGSYVSFEGNATADRMCTACATGYTNTTNATSCTAWTTCGAGTEPTNTPTSTTDRTCGACGGSEFSTGGNTACAAWTNCSAGTEPTNTPDATTDRTCAACDAGEYTAATNTACAAWTVCGAGTEPTNSPTATTDRTCGACGAGEYNSTGGNTACVAWTDCGAGTEPTNTPDASTDRTCAACDAGEYSSATNTACAAWTVCGAGTEPTNSPTATTDRTCGACGAGEYNSTGGNTACVAWTDCGVGTEPTNTPTSTTDRTCGACGAGEYNSTGGNTACVAWTDCGVGEEPTNTPDASTDRTCGACGAGGYNSTGDNTACVAWTDCGVGEEPTNTPDASTDRTCGACGAGEYNSTGGNTACVAWTDCGVGEEPTNTPDASTDRTCGACGAGEFNSAGGNTACLSCTVCGPAETEQSACTATADRVCQPATSCLAILNADVSSTDGVYSIDPDGVGGNAPFDAYCDMTTDGGGYTFYKVDAGSPANAAAADAECASRGMQLFIPRTEAHLQSAYDVATDGSFGPTSAWQYLFILGIYPNSNGATCTSTGFNSTDCANWSASDGESYWVSDRTDITEPNGDNTTTGSMGYWFDNGSYLVRTYNDLTSGYTSQYFMCDTADKVGPITATSCLDLYNAGVTSSGTYAIDPDLDGSPVNVYCDMTTDGGGYTFYKVDAGSAQTAAQAEAACAAEGMQLFIPRSEAHLQSAYNVATDASYGPSALWNYLFILGIYPTVNGATCTSTAMTSGTCTGWRASDNRGYWVSDRTNITEPNGDNTTTGSMGYWFDSGSYLVRTYNDLTSGYTSQYFMCHTGQKLPPAASCEALLQERSTAPDGVYEIDPDGDAGVNPVNAYCDMTRDGGGWTLIGKTAAGNYTGLTNDQYLALVANPSAHVNEALLTTNTAPAAGQIAFWDKPFTNALYNSSAIQNVRVDVSGSANAAVNGTYYQHHVNSPNNWDFWAAIRDAELWGDGTRVSTSYVGGLGTTFILNYGNVYDGVNDTFSDGSDGTFGWWSEYTHTLNDNSSLEVSRHAGLLNDGYGGQGNQWLVTLDANDPRWKNDNNNNRSLVWFK